MLNKLFAKKAEARNFTQGREKDFTYEVGRSMTILKYKFTDEYHCNVKVLPVVMVNGKAYIDEATTLFDGCISHDQSLKPAKAHSFLMHMIHECGNMFSAGFDGGMQYYIREASEAFQTAKSSVWATFDHIGSAIIVNIENGKCNEVLDANNMEDSFFYEVDINRA